VAGAGWRATARAAGGRTAPDATTSPAARTWTSRPHRPPTRSRSGGCSRPGTTQATIEAAWVRVPGPGIVPSRQRYEQLGPDRWRYASGSFDAELTVDADGVVVTYGELWEAVTLAGG
jgi:hypothetical protein